MEGLLTKKQNYGTNLSKSIPSPLSIHKNSHTISKPGNNNNNNLIHNNKPKIRIIHIFAPEIIKTDVENFRELVQRLTGKPTEKDCPKQQIKTAKPRMFQARDGDEDHDRVRAFQMSKPSAKRLDMNKTTSPESLGFDSRVKEEEQEEGSSEEVVGVWDNISNGHHDDHDHSNSVPGGGFLDRLSDLEGLIEEFNGEFLPSLLNPNMDPGSHMQYGFGLGGPQLA